jgi:anti-anti-sigma factor
VDLHADDRPADPGQWFRADVVRASDGRRAQLRLGGELDRISAVVLTDALAEVLRPSPPDVVELDLSALTFVDSSGIRCLLTCLHQSQEVDTRLVLLNPSPHTARVLSVTGLLDLFDLRRQPEPVRLNRPPWPS